MVMAWQTLFRNGLCLPNNRFRDKLESRKFSSGKRLVYNPKLSIQKSEPKMKVLKLLLPVFCQAKVFKPHSQRVMVNSHAFTAMANKIDSLNFRKKCMQFHFACKAGFEKAEKCWNFYNMMAELYGRHIKG